MFGDEGDKVKRGQADADAGADTDADGVRFVGLNRAECPVFPGWREPEQHAAQWR